LLPLFQLREWRPFAQPNDKKKWFTYSPPVEAVAAKGVIPFEA
jgi:hypothetical protein